MTPTGAILAGFGTQGTIRLEGCSVAFGPHDIAVDAADNIYVATGCAEAEFGSRIVATVFKTDRSGVPAAFGASGRRNDVFAAGPGNSSVASSLALDASGGLYVGGSRSSGSLFCGDFAVARLDAAGAGVSTFGQAGVALVDMGAGDRLSALALRGSRLHAVGGSLSTCPPPVGISDVMVAARLIP